MLTCLSFSSRYRVPCLVLDAGRELLSLMPYLVSPLVSHCPDAARLLNCSHFLAVSPPSHLYLDPVCELLGHVPYSVSPLVGHSRRSACRADLLSFPHCVTSLASLFSMQRVSCSASWPIRFHHSSVILPALPVVLTCSHFLAVSPPSPRFSLRGRVARPRAQFGFATRRSFSRRCPSC